MKDKEAFTRCEQLIDELVQDTGLGEKCRDIDLQERYAALVVALTMRQEMYGSADNTMTVCLSAYALVRRMQDLEQEAELAKERTVAA